MQKRAQKESAKRPFFYWIQKFFSQLSLFFPSKKSLGEQGETDAAKFLKQSGYRIVERNWIPKKGYRAGEIDIIALDKKEIVFVEVKTRGQGGKQSLPPENALTKKKMRRVEVCAYRYLREKNLLREKYRFDAVSVTYTHKGEKNIRHIRNVVI